MAKQNQLSINGENISRKIYLVRDQQVMLDADLAELYGIETRVLNQAVSRNQERFPEDFMFRLTSEEWESLRSHPVTSNNRGGRRYAPRAFSESGIAMLSSVLRSETAIQVNIQIIRTFVQLRHMVTHYEKLWRKIEILEAEQVQQNQNIEKVFMALKRLLIQEEKPKRQIGFLHSDPDE